MYIRSTDDTSLSTPPSNVCLEIQQIQRSTVFLVASELGADRHALLVLRFTTFAEQRLHELVFGVLTVRSVWLRLKIPRTGLSAVCRAIEGGKRRDRCEPAAGEIIIKMPFLGIVPFLWKKQLIKPLKICVSLLCGCWRELLRWASQSACAPHRKRGDPSLAVSISVASPVASNFIHS